MINFKKLKHEYDRISVYDIQNNAGISFGDLENFADQYSNVANEMKTSRFCPRKIMDYYFKCNKFMKIVVSQDISLHFFYIDELHESMYKIFKTIKQCIVLKKYFGITKHLNIYVVTAPDKRFMPKEGYITCQHINGGWTALNHNDIFIIRSEEFGKVILHEILHHCEHIQNDNWKREHLVVLKTHFKISENTVLVPNEAIIELWATILYTLFSSFEYGIAYNLLMNKELEYSIIQYNKILDKQNEKSWYEETNAYCYIVFKTIMLCNLEKFLKACSRPYDPTYIVNFLVTHSKSIPYKKSKDNSLRMMKFSDY